MCSSKSFDKGIHWTPKMHIATDIVYIVLTSVAAQSWCFHETEKIYSGSNKAWDGIRAWMSKYIDGKQWMFHDDVIKWKHFPRYWPFVRGIPRSPVNSAHKGQWRGALMFSLICVWINGWANNGEAGDLRFHRCHYDVTVMYSSIPNFNGGLIEPPLNYTAVEVRACMSNYIPQEIMKVIIYACPNIEYLILTDSAPRSPHVNTSTLYLPNMHAVRALWCFALVWHSRDHSGHGPT